MESTLHESVYDPTVPPEEKRRALTSGEIPVGVYGLGKMGLPVAVVFAAVTGRVHGADVDESVVESVNRGDCPVEGEPGLAPAVSTLVEDDSLRAHDDPAAVAEDAAVHVLLVPTLLKDGSSPDLSALRSALRDVGEGLDAGDMVIVESTVPPGTCRDVGVPTLAAASGLEPEEFGLAFCPERTSSGRALRDIRGAYPKVVGGKDPESTRVAEVIYGTVNDNDVIPVADCTTAECVKLFEGVYRDVNIGLANELATLVDDLDVDVNEAIDVANTQPFCDIHSPGPGVGGHCIPYYPYFLMEEADSELGLIRTAREVNETMPAFTVDRLERELAARGDSLAGASVLLLGITYRPGVNETRASPTFPIAELLETKGSEVYVADPVCGDQADLSAERVATSNLEDLDVDGVVLVTAHDEFESIDWEALGRPVVLDGRQALDSGAIDAPVYTIGSGRSTGRNRQTPPARIETR